MVISMNQESFRKQSEELSKTVLDMNSGNLPAANIIVAGISGTGKSTLINAVFGENMAKTGIGRPITASINDYSIPDVPIRIWDTVGLELNSDKTKASIKDIRETIANKTASKNQFDRIHAIWYCISSGSHKYLDVESDFVKNLHSIGVPFIIVMTQCISEEEDNELEVAIREINQSEGMNDIEVVQVLAKDYNTRLGTIPSLGLDRLVDITTNKLPEFIKSGFVAAQRIDVVNKRIESEKIIIDCVRDAKKGFWDKVPLVNLFTTDKRVRTMTSTIGTLYNTVLTEENVSKIINKSGFSSRDAFEGLIFDSSFKKKVDGILVDMSRNEGFTVEEREFASYEKVARMVAYYGYTFVVAIEELWNKLTEDQLKDIDFVVINLISIINQKLDEMRRGKNGKH